MMRLSYRLGILACFGMATLTLTPPATTPHTLNTGRISLVAYPQDSASPHIPGTLAADPQGISTPGFPGVITTNWQYGDALSNSHLLYIIGGSMNSIPDTQWSQASERFAEHLGFQGTYETIPTPEGLYPISGPQSLELKPSVALDVRFIMDRVVDAWNNHQFSTHDPLTLLADSQSTIALGEAMTQMKADGIPTDAIRVVLLADVDNPSGGFQPRFDTGINGVQPYAPSLGINFHPPIPTTDYPTYVYTTEYDVFADFPRYPLDIIADINAYLGVTQHLAYQHLSDQAINNAEILPVSNENGDNLSHFFMIPDQTLPMLDPLTFFPGGDHLAALIEPTLRTLVDIGYGSLTQGWDTGDFNQWVPFGIFPTISLPALINALDHDIIEGIHDFITSFEHNQLTDLTLNDVSPASLLSDARQALSYWCQNCYPAPDVSIFNSPPGAIMNAWGDTISTDFAELEPIINTIYAELFSIPKIDIASGLHFLEEGNIEDALLAPLAEETGVAPFLGLYGIVVPIFEGTLGTITNIADITGLGDISF